MAVDEGKELYDKFRALTDCGKAIEALDFLDKACEAGNKDALLAKAEITGFDDENSLREYTRLIDLACEAGSAEAWARKGDLMFMSSHGGEEILALDDGVSREEKEKFIERLPLIRKFDCYAQAAELGYVKAYEFLGDTLSDDKNAFLAEKDAKKEAAAYYARGAEKGSEKCILAIAECLENGVGTSENVEKAIELYTALADKGNRNAMLRLCEIYSEGRKGVEIDRELAAKYMLMTGLTFDE